jgi:valyl-tRNA synthetase
MSLPDRFDTKSESEIYKRWEEAGVFTADSDRSKRTSGERDPFTIVMPR